MHYTHAWKTFLTVSRCKKKTHPAWLVREERSGVCWPRVSPAFTAEEIWGWRRCLSLHLPPPFQMHWARSKECPKCVEQFGLCPSLSTRVVHPPQVAAAPFTQGPNPWRRFSLKAGKKHGTRTGSANKITLQPLSYFPSSSASESSHWLYPGRLGPQNQGRSHQLPCFFINFSASSFPVSPTRN